MEGNRLTGRPAMEASSAVAEVARLVWALSPGEFHPRLHAASCSSCCSCRFSRGAARARRRHRRLIQERDGARHIRVSRSPSPSGKIVKVRGYGVANLEHDVPVTPETVFELASVTKAFTASAIMLLVEEGKVQLDDRRVAPARAP